MSGARDDGVMRVVYFACFALVACGSEPRDPDDPQVFSDECRVVCDRYQACGVDSASIQRCNNTCLQATFVQDAQGCRMALGLAQNCALDETRNTCDDQLASACDPELASAVEDCTDELSNACAFECDACSVGLRSRCRALSAACEEGGPGLGQVRDCCAGVFTAAQCS